MSIVIHVVTWNVQLMIVLYKEMRFSAFSNSVHIYMWNLLVILWSCLFVDLLLNYTFMYCFYAYTLQ